MVFSHRGTGGISLAEAQGTQSFDFLIFLVHLAIWGSIRIYRNGHDILLKWECKKHHLAGDAMSATLLYRIQGVRVYKYQKTNYEKDCVKIHFSIPKDRCVCPVCGHDTVWIKEMRTREFTGVPLGHKKVILVATIPKIYCPVCHANRQVHLAFARPNKHYTRSFESYVLRLLQDMTVQAAADFLNVSWDTVRDIEQHYLEKHFSNPSFKGVRYIAIDEISSKKGFILPTHRFFRSIPRLPS